MTDFQGKQCKRTAAAEVERTIPAVLCYSVLQFHQLLQVYSWTRSSNKKTSKMTLHSFRSAANLSAIICLKFTLVWYERVSSGLYKVHAILLSSSEVYWFVSMWDLTTFWATRSEPKESLTLVSVFRFARAFERFLIFMNVLLEGLMLTYLEQGAAVRQRVEDGV